MTFLEREFTKFLKHLKFDLNLFKVTALSPGDIEEYGEMAVDGIDFNGYRIIKSKHKYETISFAEPRFRDGFVHEVYVVVTTSGDRDNPPDVDEVYLFGKEYSSKVFLEIVSHMNEEALNDALMCDGLVPLFPFVVNYTWENEKGQFSCEAENEDHALEQCSDAYPGCEIDRILKQGEE